MKMVMLSINAVLEALHTKYIGRELFSALLFLALLLAGCADCDGKEMTWQEQYDLGVRYLSEGKYEEALFAFEKAIEIDPQQVKVYSVLAEVYISQNNWEKAKDILEQGIHATADEALEMAANVTEAWAKGNINTEINTIVDDQGRDIRRNYYNAEGEIENYQILYYENGTDAVRTDMYNSIGELESYTLYYGSEDGLRFYSESFFPDGTSGRKTVQVMDEEGNWLYNACIDENGNETKTSIAVNDETGSGWNNYDENGTLTSYARSENGRIVYYNADGTVEMIGE